MKDSDNDFTFTPADQPLPPIDGQETDARKDTPYIKSRNWQGPGLVLVACVIIGITFSQWQRLVAILLAGDYQNALPVFTYSVIGLVVSIALFVATAILIKDNALVFLVSTIYAVLPFAALPRTELTTYFIIASAILVSSAAFSIRSEAELLIKPSIRKYFKAGALRYFTAASLAVAFCTFANFNSYVTTIEKLVPMKVFNFYMEEMYRQMPNSVTLPRDNSNENVDAKDGVIMALPQANEDIDGYLDRVAHQTMNKALAEAVAKADKNARQEMVITAAEIDAMVTQMRSDLSEQAGIELTGQEGARPILYKIFVIKADALMAAYSQTLPVFAGIAAFALMRVLCMLAYYPALILTSILMLVGQGLKLWKMEDETVTLKRYRL